MVLVDDREAGIYWQSRMGNNADGIGGNCHRYDVVTAGPDGRLVHRHFLVDYGLKLGGQHHACEFPSPVGLLARRDTGRVDGGGAPPEALLLTHAHEDHIGAIRHVIDMGYQVPPIHCSAFTAQMVVKSLVNDGVGKDQWPEINIVKAGQAVSVANAQVECVAIDHMPGALALAIRTPEAAVFHTGDYKFDDTLVLGERADPKRLKAIGKAGIDMVVADSTSAAEPGAKISEDRIRKNLMGLVADNEGRAVVAGILGSQLDRLVSLGRAAAANRRALLVTGRSLQDNIVALRRSGIDVDRAAGTRILTAAEAQELPADKVLVVTTGAFGQPNAGLTRAAHHLPGSLWIGGDTTVVIPQRAIGPVKGAQAGMVARLEERGAHVVTAERAEAMGYGPIHQTGHATEQDTRLLYTLLRPKRLVAPTHGDADQVEANARIARSLGIEALPLGHNGSVVRVNHQGADVVGREDVHRIGAIDTGEAKHLPRAAPGEGARPRPAPVAYRYVELDADGNAIAGRGPGAAVSKPSPAAIATAVGQMLANRRLR